jgi:hypothetical protein
MNRNSIILSFGIFLTVGVQAQTAGPAGTAPAAIKPAASAPAAPMGTPGSAGSKLVGNAGASSGCGARRSGELHGPGRREKTRWRREEQLHEEM